MPDQETCSDSDTLTRTSGSLRQHAVGILGRIERGIAAVAVDYRPDADGNSKKGERTNGGRSRERNGERDGERNGERNRERNRKRGKEIGRKADRKTDRKR